MRDAVDEQWVVGALDVVDGQVEGVEVRPGRGLGDGEGRGPGQAVGGALDVGVEGVARVEARGVGLRLVRDSGAAVGWGSTTVAVVRRAGRRSAARRPARGAG